MVRAHAVRDKDRDQIEQRRDIERPGDIRILERRHRAVVHHEHFRARKGLEVAEHAEDRGDHGGADISGADDGKAAHGVLGHHRGEDHAADGEIDRDDDEGLRFLVAENRDQRGHAADLQHEQQEDHRHDLHVDTHPREQAGKADDRRQALIRRRLDDGQEAGENAGVERDLEDLDGKTRRRVRHGHGFGSMRSKITAIGRHRKARGRASSSVINTRSRS